MEAPGGAPWWSIGHQYPLRDWSLITGRGATEREGGGGLKFYPYEKGGGSFSNAEGGEGRQKQVWGSFSAEA